MPAKPTRNHFDHSLLSQDAARQALLERMRGKMAMPTVAPAAIRAGQRKARVRRNRAWAWGWRLALGLLVLGANAFLTGTREEQAGTVAKVRTAPILPAPSSRLSESEQALYWTYALYDYDRLVKRFGAPANAVVDAALARRRLKELLPKVDRKTRFIVERHLPKTPGRA